MAGDAVEIGKVAVRIIPTTKTTRQEAQVQLEEIERRLKAIHVDIELDTAGLGTEAAAAREQAQRKLKDLKLNLNLDDRTDLKRGIGRVQEELRKLGREEVVIGLNEDELNDALTDFEGRVKDIQTVMDLSFDEKSLDSVERTLGTVERELAKLEERTITVDLDKDSLNTVRKELLDLREVQVKAKIEADNRSFHEMRRVIDDRFGTLDFKVDLDDATARKTEQRIKNLLQKQYELSMEVQPTLSDRERHELEREIRNIDGEIEVELDQFHKRKLQAEMALLSRTRDAQIVPWVNQAAAAKVAATLAALSGGRALKDIGQDIADWVGNLDKAVPKIATVTLAIGNLASAALTSTANLTSFLASLGWVFQSSLALPGIVGGLAIGIGSTIAVMKDFNKVIPEMADKLHDLQDAMSERFWKVAEQPIRRLIDDVFPEFDRSIQKTSTALGGFFANLANSARGRFGGELHTMFADLDKSIKIAAEHTDAFMGILQKLGSVGAGNLPRLAQWFGEISDKFDNWLGKKGQEGLQQFVDTGIDALKDLGAILRDTGSTFATLGRIAEETGASTLKTFRATMADVRKTVESQDFQVPLRKALIGARSGLENFSSEIGKSFKNILKRIANLAGEALPILGSAGGDLLGGVFRALDQNTVSTSVLNFFKDIRKSVTNLTSALPGVARGLAGIVDVLGTLTVGTSRALGHAFEVIGPSVEKLAKHIDPLAKELTRLTDIAIKAAGPVFEKLADTLGVLADALVIILKPINALGEAMGKLPGPVKAVLSSLASVGVIVGAATWMGAGVRNKIASLGFSMQTLGTHSTIAGRQMQAMGRGVSGLASKMTMGKIAFGGLAVASTLVADKVGLSNTAMGAMMGTLAGPWGAAIGGAVGLTMDLVNSFKDLKDNSVRVDEILNDRNAGAGDQIAAMTSRLKEYKKAQDDVQNIDGFGDTFDTTFKRVGQVFEQATTGTNTLSKEFIKTVKDGNNLGALLNTLNATVTDLGGVELSFTEEFYGDKADRIKVFGDNLGEVERTLTQLQPAMDKLGLSTTDLLKGNWVTNSKALAETMAELNSMAGRTQAVEDAFDGVGTSIAGAKAEAENLGNALNALMSPGAGLIQARDAFKEGLRNLSKNLDDTTGSLFANTDAAQNNRGVIMDLATDMADLAVAQVNAGRDGGKVKESFDRNYDAIIRMAESAGYGKKEITKLLAEMGLTPDVVKSRIDIEGAEKAKNDIRGVQNTLKALPGGAALGAAFGASGGKDPFNSGAIKKSGDAAAKAAATGRKGIEKALKVKAPAPDMKALNNGVMQVRGLIPIAYSSAVGIGYALKSGVINGVSGLAATLAAQTRSAVAGAILSAKLAGAIHSPSKKMQWIGEMLAAGAARGIKLGTLGVTRAAAAMSSSVLAGYSNIAKRIDNTLARIDKKASKAWKKSHAAQIKRLKQMGNAYDKAVTKLKNLVQQQKQYAQQVKSTIVQSGNPTGFDVISPEGIVAGMQDAILQARKFNALLQELQKKGLNKETYKQILEAGPQAGADIAESVLLAGVKTINSLQGQLNSAASNVAKGAGAYVYGDLVKEAQKQVNQLLRKLGPTNKKLKKFASSLMKALNKQLKKAAKANKVTEVELNWAPVAGSTSSVGSGVSGSGSAISKTTVINYYAAGGEQLTAEEKLFGAVKRARMVTA